MPAGAAVLGGRGQGTWPEAAFTRCLFRCLGESKGRAGARVPAPKRLGCTYPASGAHRSTRPQHTETRVTPAARAPASPSSNFRRGETEAGRGEATAKVTARGWRSRQAGRARAPDPGGGLRLRSVPAFHPALGQPRRHRKLGSCRRTREVGGGPAGRWRGGGWCDAGPARAAARDPLSREPAAPPPRPRLHRRAGGSREPRRGSGIAGGFAEPGPGEGYEATVVGTTQVAWGCRDGD